MYCSRCGLRIEEGARFCQACGQGVGAALPGAPAAMTAPPPAPAVSAPTSPQLPYAGFWVRFAAYLIDGLILGIPFGLLVVVSIFLLGGFGLVMRGSSANPVDPSAAAAAVAGPIVLGIIFGWLFLLVITWLYFAGMESSERQATFGKSVMSLRVTNLEGQRLSFGHATGRFFAKIVSGMIPLAIGYIMAGFTAKKQALHDLIAGTLVLQR
jgi:uncharacterized RDD family membrane protein YckC